MPRQEQEKIPKQATCIRDAAPNHAEHKHFVRRAGLAKARDSLDSSSNTLLLQ